MQKKQSTLVYEIAVAIYGFILGAMLVSSSYITRNSGWCITFILHSAINIITCVKLYSRSMLLKVVFISEVLGLVFACAILFSWKMFGWYFAILSCFHFTEYLSIALVNPKSLTLSSFLLNHSAAYGIAALCSWIEFWLEYLLIPSWKLPAISYVGLSLCIGGEIIRKLSMFTAKSNFHHLVQIEQPENHQLVTKGIYGVCRHPSYVGWFFWSLGTQMILVNPLCFFIYLMISWSFFKDRIELEEWTLLNFYGPKYKEYQQKVPTGILFISGCVDYEENEEN